MKTRSERWKEIDAAVERVRPMFSTLTSEDWAREIRRARALPNEIADRIRAKILNLGKSESENLHGGQAHGG